MRIISVFIIMLRSGFCHKSGDVQRGSDVSLRCDVPFLSESSTLHWEKDGEQTSNTTLMYNNSAFIILHTVDEHSKGNYYCILTKEGSVETVKRHTLTIASNSYNEKSKAFLIYRQSSSNSEVLLICKSRKVYENLKWTWAPRPDSQIDLIAFKHRKQVQLKGPIKPGRRSSKEYDSQALIFHVSPVKFNYSGTYRCITETTTYTTIILHTIRVSVEPSDGVLMNQSVVFTCQLSEVTGSVTLVWLRMEGNRGVLVKQQMMTEKNQKLQLTVNVSSYESDLMNWQCAVFTENTLRALAPVTNYSLTSTATNEPDISTETSTGTNKEDSVTQDSHPQIAISVACAVSVLILLGLLVFTCQRKTGHIAGLKSEEDEEIHYASVTVAGSNQGTDSWLKMKQASSEVCCQTPCFTNILDCHPDLMHGIYVCATVSTILYFSIFRRWTENLKSSTQRLKQSEHCHWKLHTLYILITAYTALLWYIKALDYSKVLHLLCSVCKQGVSGFHLH
ncbi:uncharacterized protein LOC122352014 isoform X2 [Puntigrus tetrazona]|uniref:uncharacterized protein LOC122352014 isoform X2 n=1 Tax=Puntigrus tetrazona TaxID=1606681 RepID=UPI001C8A8F92|nr:uncharacterized protein LOC122352014 isoform X2 [Puntigrus tetrazona]